MESMLALAANNGALRDVLTLVGALILVAVTVVVMMVIERARRSSSTQELEMRRTAAEAEAAKIVAEAKASAEAEFHTRREKFDEETHDARGELRVEKKRLAKREDLIDQKLGARHARGARPAG